MSAPLGVDTPEKQAQRAKSEKVLGHPLNVLPEKADYEPPKLIRSVAPVYPAGAKKRGIIGSVSIGVVIDESGAIADAKILESSNTELNEAAIAAVRQWRFTGAKKDGKPIRVYYTIPIVFQIP